MAGGCTMPDRYHNGLYRDWEVTLTVTVPAATSEGAVHKAIDVLGIGYSGYLDHAAAVEARPA